MHNDYSRSEAKAFAKQHLQGIFSAIPLPETDDGDIDEAGLRLNVRHCIDHLGSAGIYLHGYFGHFWLLTSEERRRALEIVVDEVADDALVIARCAHESPRESIELIRHAEQAGAHFISMLGPQYGWQREDTVYDYFDTIARETRLGISIFNTTQVGHLFSPGLMARLAEIPNVVALKNAASVDHSMQVRAAVGDGILVVQPQEEQFLTSLLHFDQKVIYTNTNYMFDTPKSQPMRDYMQAALDGDAARAIAGYYALQPVRNLHTKWIRGGWEHLGHCPIATVKYWVEQLGMAGGSVRAPMPPLTAAEREELLADLEAVGLTT